jgi:hypothetical protein
MPNLEDLQLNFNRLTGSLPARIPSKMTYMYLNANALTGTIPSSWGADLSNLAELALSSNQLNGTIPSELSQISTLQKAWFFGNSFTGSVDQFFCDGTVRLGALEADCAEVKCTCCTHCCDDGSFSPVSL